MVTTITDNLEHILSTGYSILEELEKENPDIEQVEKLFNHRAKQIEKLAEKWQHGEIDVILEKEKNSINSLGNLFLRLKLLEKALNRRLSLLKQQKADVLNHLTLIKSVSNKYSGNHGPHAPVFVDVISNN